MASVRPRLGADLAKAELAVAKATGVEIGLSHRGSDMSSFWATVLEERVEFQPATDYRTWEVVTVEFLIPVQDESLASGYDGGLDIFAMTADAKPITENDKIEYPVNSGRFLYVTDVPKVTHEGYVYNVTAVSNKSLTTGARS